MRPTAIDAAIVRAQQVQAYVNARALRSITTLTDFERPGWRRWVIQFADGFTIRTSDPSIICQLNARAEVRQAS